MLKLRCRIYLQAGKWDYLGMLAESCYSAHPQDEQFLIDWAWAEYKQGRTDKAAMILLLDGEGFPESEEVAFDLAVVLASLGRVAEARDWLAKTFARAEEPDKVKLRALEQAELEKVWTEKQAGG